MPETSSAVSPQHEALIASAIGRSGRRLRLQRGLDFAVFSIIPVAAALLIVMLAFKRRWLEADDLVLIAGASAGGVVFLSFMLGFLWRIPTITAARALDAGANLHDRLGSAYDFEKVPAGERSAFMNAAIRDAARAADGLRVGRFVKLSRPHDLTMALVLMGAVVLFGILRIPFGLDFVLPSEPTRAPPPPPPMVPTFQALLAQQKVEESQKEAERLKDPETKKLLGQIDKLWKGIHGHQFDKRELWRRIAALQKQKLGKLSNEDKAELGRLRKTGEAMPSTGVTSKLADALKKGDLQKAQDALRELGKKLQQKSLSKKERNQLEKALKKAAAQTQKQLNQMKRKLEKLQKQLNKRKLQKLAKEKKQRELQKLSKELEKMQSQLTTQLSQELMDALKKMKKYEDGDAGQSLEKAADKMKEMMKKLRKLQLMSKTQDHIREMKELLRRGNQQGRDEQLKDFMARAGNGQGELTLKLPGEGQEQGSGGQGDQPGGRSLKQLGGGKKCDTCGGGHATGQHGQAGKGGQGGDGKGKGPGWGSGAGDKSPGQSTSVDAKYVDQQLKGKKGRGDSTSEIFMGAATKGFSRVAYKNVYQKYKEHVEEALEKNKAIPPGQKRIVEKYFEMIRPK